MRVIIAVLIFLGLGVVIVAAVTFHGYRSKSERVGVYSKTFWDWLTILIVPVLLTSGGVLFAAYQDIRQQSIEDQRAARQRELEDQRAGDAALQAYFDGMTQLLLEEGLRDSQPEDATSALARARTITLTRRLDGGGRGSVVQFLYESRKGSDESKNKHATKHFRATEHPIVQSFQPGEDWIWCYVDEVVMEPR